MSDAPIVPHYDYCDSLDGKPCNCPSRPVVPAPSLNHGGPGICRLCYPNGAPVKPAVHEQGELQL